MLQSLNTFAGIDFFQGARPEAVFWGRIALGVGIAGLLASVLLTLAHWRDQFSLRRGSRNPEQYRAPRWGPLNGALGEFFADPLHNAPLSPDAASEYVTGRLDAQHEVIQSAIRYFSYAPLLLGLMGTTFALRALLITGGDTLQQIQPHLSGVFAGTLAGIAGSLLGAIGGLVLDKVALSTANRAQDFIHRFILPTLPERRIAIRIEDAVLALIGERAQAVAETFRNALQPVAAELEDIAVRCGKAAEAASSAFSETTRAVREAGNLETASRNFKAGAHMIDSSAEQLSDATKQTAEIVLRVGDVRASLAGLLDRVQATSENLGTASERVGSQLTAQLVDLNTQALGVHNAAGGLRLAIDALSTELLRRASADSAQIDAIKGYAEQNDRTLGGLTQLARESSDGVKSLQASIDGKAFEGIRRDITTTIGESTERIRSAVETLNHRFDQFGSSAAERGQTGKQGEPESPNASIVLREAVTEVRRAADESRRLVNEVQRLQSVSRDDTGPKKPGFFRRFWE